MGSGQIKWDSRQQRHYSRRPINLLAVAALLVVLAFTLACEGEGDFSATPATATGPAPTATLMPTLPPSPTPEPTATTVSGGAAPTIDQALIEEMLAAVPADFRKVAFLDLATLAQDPDLQDLLEQQGLLEAFGPVGAAIQSQLASAAIGSNGDEVIGVMRGPLVIPDLIELLTFFGAAVETRMSGEFEVVALAVDTPILELSLALTSLDEETFIFATGVPEGVTATDHVMAALDTLSGTTPGFVSEPAVKALIEVGLPPGFLITISEGCEEFGEIQGCLALALGFVREGDRARMESKLNFGTSEIALVAAPLVQAELAVDPDFSGEATVDGTFVLIKGTVSLSGLME